MSRRQNTVLWTNPLFISQAFGFGATSFSCSRHVSPLACCDSQCGVNVFIYYLPPSVDCVLRTTLSTVSSQYTAWLGLALCTVFDASEHRAAKGDILEVIQFGPAQLSP